MFTHEIIDEALNRVKSGADFPKYVQELKSFGVTHYDHYVSDGNNIYYGLDEFELKGKSKYPHIPINDIGSSDKLKHTIAIHQQGGTDYLTFCEQAAEAGVHKWTTSILKMTVEYLDKNGNAMVLEAIRNPD